MVHEIAIHDLADEISGTACAYTLSRVSHTGTRSAAVAIPVHSVSCHRSTLADPSSICAIAARHYTKRNDLHARLSSYGKRLAFEVPSRGYKSVEVVQAYLLLSLWTLGPEKTFEQDRTWMMLGGSSGEVYIA